MVKKYSGNGRLIVATGKSRSGKTAFVLDQIKDCRLVWVYDPEEQYDCTLRAKNKKQLFVALQKALLHKDNCKVTIAFTTSNAADFNYWCECAFVLATQRDKRKLVTDVVAEEIADVTSPGKAPPGWGKLIRRGLKRNCNIYAVTQRPAESDKTAFGNASIIHCCAMNTASDRKTIAEYLDIPVLDVKNMVADQEKGRFDYYQRNLDKGKTTAGVLTFRNKKPVFTSKNP